MEKESVKKFDLEAAFKALDEIDIPVAEKGIKANRVDLKERFNQKSAHEALVEDYYDVSSHEDLEEAQDEREAEVAQAKLARIEKIVDLDADSPDDLLPSYVGKVIIQCPQCMTLFYKNPEDIEKSEENPDVVNINEVCQHCGNASGYTLIGKVDSVGADEADNYTEEPTGEKNELDLDFEEPTKEVDAEGTGEGAKEMSDENELSDDELKELDLDLAEIPEEEPEEEKKEESLNLSKETSENETEYKSENLTLNEEVDKDLDAKLKEHNDYIAYLQQMIKQEEEALKKTDNEEVKAAIQRRLDAFNTDLEAALPDAVKEEAPVEEIPETAEADETPAEEPAEEPTKVQAEEEPKEEPAEEEASVEEALTEDGAEEEKPAEGNEVDYVEYKHSYCHALAPKLKAINYLVNVKKVEPKILKGYILKLLKDADVKWTEKEKEFKKNIEAKDDAYDILNYVKNSIEKAKTIKVKVDENGELVEGLNEGFEGCLYEVLTESLNKSEEAPSEHETENGSENLTLNEDASSEIDSIIASWGDVSESLTEESDLDKLLDSDEFKTPVSKAEIDAAREDAKEESLEECSKQELTEEPDPEVKAIVDSWKDTPEAPVEEACEGSEREEGYTGNPAERTTHLEYADDDPADGKAVLPDNIEKQLTEGEKCKDGECEKPLEECGENCEKPLKEEDEVPAEEEAPAEEPAEEPAEGEEAVEEEPKEELPNVEFSTEEVKEVAQEAAEEVVKEAEAEVEPEVVEEKVEEVVADAAEEKVEAEEEAPVESEEAPVEAEEPEFSEDDVDELDECSLNKHIDEYLHEVYSNVKSYETTGCELKEGKLIVEGKISFNSGKEKLTMFEFLPAYCEGKLFFEGYNKDFSEDKAFTLNCSINESKTLITESFGYKYKINENLVEGLK